MRYFIASGAVILSGLGGYFLGQSTLSQPVEQADEIAALLPDDMVEAIRDEAQRKSILSIWEQIAPTLKALEGEAKSHASLEVESNIDLPEGVPNPPFFTQAPGEGVRWPDATNLVGGEALEAAKDGWVVMNVWASWCAPCVAELPDIQNAANALVGENITLLTINADVTGKDGATEARKILAQRSASDLPFIMAEGETRIKAFIGQIFQDPNITSFPYTVIYAPRGVPFATFSGGTVSDDAIWAGDAGLAFFRGLAGA